MSCNVSNFLLFNHQIHRPLFLYIFKAFYGDKFGYDVIDVIKDSSVVDPNRLDPNKVNIYFPFVIESLFPGK